MGAAPVQGPSAAAAGGCRRQHGSLPPPCRGYRRALEGKPGDPPWLDGRGLEQDDRRSLTELPGRPRGALQVEDCLGKPGWWERRPGGTEGM